MPKLFKIGRAVQSYEDKRKWVYVGQWVYFLKFLLAERGKKYPKMELLTHKMPKNDSNDLKFLHMMHFGGFY